MTDREQIRRDAEGDKFCAESVLGLTGAIREVQPSDARFLAERLLVRLAELEQAERRIEEVEFGARAERGMREQAEQERDEAKWGRDWQYEKAVRWRNRCVQAERERNELKARQGDDALDGPAPSDRRSPFGTRGLTDE